MVIIMDQVIIISLYGKCIVKEGWREMRREKEGEKRKRKTREKKNERIIEFIFIPIALILLFSLYHWMVSERIIWTGT